MPRAFWKGVISFGMVAIPVRMSVATESKTISFHRLHKKCLTRPKQVLFCPVDEIYFDIADTVRGYEYAKDQFVVLEEEDFEKVPLRTTHSIEIAGFVKASEIESIYYEDTHYIEPEEMGAKPFTLLKTVLEKTGMVGIAKVAFARREHLACIRPLGKILALHTLHYRQEILSTEDMSPPEQKVTAAELSMATKLVEAMTTNFKPDEFKDEYAEALRKMVDSKLKGIEIKTPEMPKMKVEDLMSALKASVAAASKK
jgi:DNA end-binding protein Ku